MRLLLPLMLSLAACGASQSPAAPAAALAPVAASAAPASSSASSAPSAEMHHAPRPPQAVPAITVTYDGRQVDVDPSAVAKGAAKTSFLDLWKAAFPNDDASALTFDLVGSDGFRPTSRPACSHLLSASELSTGTVEVASHDLAFDEGVKLPKCYRVKALSRIEAKK